MIKKKVTRLITFLIVFLSINKCFAQQEPQFTLFWNNYSVFNPASTGLLYKNYFSLNARNQLSEFEGNSRTISMVYDHNFEKIKSGIGLNYYFTKLGLEKNNKINLNYSYHFQFNNNQKLSIGLSLSYLRKSIDFSRFNFPDQQQLDYNGITSDNLIDFNFGTIYKTENFLIGISVTQLKASEFKKFNFKNQRHYFITCSYNLLIGNNFETRPTIYLKAIEKEIYSDFNLLSFYKKIYWFGISYRTTNTYAVIIGCDIKSKFRFGYSFENSPTKFDLKLNSHEIIFAIMIN